MAGVPEASVHGAPPHNGETETGELPTTSEAPTGAGETGGGGVEDSVRWRRLTRMTTVRSACAEVVVAPAPSPLAGSLTVHGP